MEYILGIIIFGLLIFGIVSAGISIYNKLVVLKHNIEKSFANIEVLLKQRAEEIPNLINIVKEFQQFERSTLEELTKLRTRYMQSDSIEEKVKVSNEMEKSLGKIFAVSENYPALKSHENFIQLQKRYSEIEDGISHRREFFNDSVNLYNIGIHKFPDLLFAKILGYSEKPMLTFTTEEKKFDGIKF